MAFHDFQERTYVWMSTLGFRICVHTISYPFDYAKFLIQIGHEPQPPYPSKTFFGQPIMILPNVFRYAKYIMDTEGFICCYRGFIPKLTGQLVGTLAAENVTKNFKVIEDPGEDEVLDEERWLHFKQSLVKDVAATSVTIVVSHPFYVLSSRIMAQFVGGEETYNSIFGGVKEIFNQQGFFGFFSGLLPRYIGEITALVLSSSIVFGINTYVIEDKELKSFVKHALQFACNALVYPLSVVSACMSVNNCGLAAGQPPQMPLYNNWADCFRDLYHKGEMKRGSNMILRYVKKSNDIKIRSY